MTWKIVSLTLVLVAVAICASNTESPGFFLKVAKNVPRLGRRADADTPLQHQKRADYVPDTNSIDEQRPTTWYERLVQPAATKRVLTATTSARQSPEAAAAAASAAYRKVQPFDSNVLIDLITSSADSGHPIGEDLKFVSWRDFDIALESDTELYRKLVELAQGEAELLAAGHHPIEIEHFVSMDEQHGNHRIQPLGRHYSGTGMANGGGMFYRVDRDAPQQKERVEYQM